jgi:hypothetical protein
MYTGEGQPMSRYTTKEQTVNLSDGSSYAAELCVYRDYIEGNGAWRLFWLNPGTSCGVQEQSTVTGQPFFRTMRAAILHGQKRYGITARRAPELD